MSAPDSAADPGPPALGDSRARVLSLLQDAGTPLGVEEVATRVRLHPNTARFHLDGLAEAGLVHRTVEERDQPGRPRALYAARADAAPAAGRRSYRVLAGVLASAFADRAADPSAEAREVGEVWGRQLATDGPPDQPQHSARPLLPLDAGEATGRLVTALDGMGFLPEPVEAAGGRAVVVRMYGCPFREVARQHQDVVCSLHLGLMRGFLAQLRAPLEAQRLEPFVEPGVCVAHLLGRPTAPSGG